MRSAEGGKSPWARQCSGAASRLVLLFPGDQHGLDGGKMSEKLDIWLTGEAEVQMQPIGANLFGQGQSPGFVLREPVLIQGTAVALAPVRANMTAEPGGCCHCQNAPAHAEGYVPPVPAG